MGLGYLFFEEVSGFSAVKKLQEELAKDRETISNHWRQDSDLILLTKIIRVGCLFVASYSELCTLAVITDFRYSSCGLQLKVAGGLLCVILFTVFFAKIHIIFYRNFPVINKILSLAQSSVKAVGAGLVMGAG
jgi:ABC-type transport system involved in cytochrome bd biosynthesis fused ATPase/permease subunit